MLLNAICHQRMIIKILYWPQACKRRWEACEYNCGLRNHFICVNLLTEILNTNYVVFYLKILFSLASFIFNVHKAEYLALKHKMCHKIMLMNSISYLLEHTCTVLVIKLSLETKLIRVIMWLVNGKLMCCDAIWDIRI